MLESKAMMEAFIESHGTKEEWYNDGKQTWHNALASFKYGWEAGKEFSKRLDNSICSACGEPMKYHVGKHKFCKNSPHVFTVAK